LPEGHELHNFDEASKQLLSTPRGNITAKPVTDMTTSRPKMTDYEYKRHGTRNLFVAVAPYKGTRTITVTRRRTAQDTADFLWHYCMIEHRSAGHIHLVLDNLNTHKTGCLKKVWGEGKLRLFLKHVTPHYTPPHGSWLNMAELEINCLRKQGVKARIKDGQALTQTVAAIVAERNARQATIRWSFGLEKAQEKFPQLYESHEN